MIAVESNHVLVVNDKPHAAEAIADFLRRKG